MSIYSALSVDVPVINYSVLHQMKKGTEEKEYVKTIHEMHRMMRVETEKIRDSWKNHLSELTATSVQSTRGALSQFLTLPLEGDVKEIHRILDDQVRQLYKQVLPAARLGVLATTEGKFIWDKDPQVLLQTLLGRGKDYLKKMKFRTSEEHANIFESDFIVEGGFNLDIIEHIVRDRMGIYATAHGQHIQESEPFVFATHNLVFLGGSLERNDAKYEATLHFSKGKPQYTPFRKELTNVLQSTQEDVKLAHCSLWQRKLGLGQGTEFNIRLRASDRKALREFILRLAREDGKNLFHAPVFDNGCLLVKELTR